MNHNNSLDNYYRDSTFIGAMQGAIDNMKTPGAGNRKPSRSSSRPNVKPSNFSYPRADGHPPRHESADSRSSVTSNGSMPGMTDASDSEVSVDDDYHYNASYNASACQLFDSFWPSGSDRKHQRPRSPAAMRASSSRDYFTIQYSTPRQEETESDTVTLTRLEQETPELKSSIWPFAPKSISTRPQGNRKSTYSIYPRPSPVSDAEVLLPPRTTSLATELAPPTRSRTLKASKSLANLKSKSRANLLPPPPMPAAVTAMHTSSSPISPVGTPPTLRPSASAYNIREQQRCAKTQHNPTAPLAPMPRLLHDHIRPVRPQVERFVSVFELDSDNESDAENNGFANMKRIARGLHKKSNSHQRGGSEQRASIGLNGEESLSRKRGGSLGRILGLNKNRS